MAGLTWRRDSAPSGGGEHVSNKFNGLANLALANWALLDLDCGRYSGLRLTSLASASPARVARPPIGVGELRANQWSGITARKMLLVRAVRSATRQQTLSKIEPSTGDPDTEKRAVDQERCPVESFVMTGDPAAVRAVSHTLCCDKDRTSSSGTVIVSITYCIAVPKSPVGSGPTAVIIAEAGRLKRKAFSNSMKAPTSLL